jgi:hypothetical protein
MTTNHSKTSIDEKKDKPKKFMIVIPVGKLPKHPTSSSSK